MRPTSLKKGSRRSRETGNSETKPNALRILDFSTPNPPSFPFPLLSKRVGQG